MFDVMIIGAGIVGSFLAHDLSKYEIKVGVMEKNSDVANGATMANSAIIHSGHDPKEGTLKARFNVRGNEMYEGICRELGVSFKRTSALVVATSKEEEETLDRLYQQAESRKVPVSYLTREEVCLKEKNISDYVTKAIELPTTGIIYPWEVAIALMEEAMINGVELFLEEKVEAIEKVTEADETYFIVTTNKGQYQTKHIINAAGVYADNVYGMVCENKEFTITARKGEYFVLDKAKEPLVNSVIYPVPSSVGKGVLVVPTTHGNTLLGPNSVFVEDKEDNSNTKEALDYVKREIGKTVKNVPMAQVIRIFSGLRATGNTGDFVIEESKLVENFINVACVESPGLTAAPAISEYVVQTILSNKLDLSEKKNYEKRRPVISLAKMSEEEKNELVKRNPSFGKIVCRCEQITEGEILDAIRRPLGAKTVKGVKKRVRPGMGRCQGGFCEPLVVDILAKELGISPLEVRLDGEASVLLMEETKGGN